ncbi:hypothetical protein DPSP01_009932 [Paraphaeosphaeria sporulosa]
MAQPTASSLLRVRNSAASPRLFQSHASIENAFLIEFDFDGFTNKRPFGSCLSSSHCIRRIANAIVHFGMISMHHDRDLELIVDFLQRDHQESLKYYGISGENPF